jgi:hypothetical protein
MSFIRLFRFNALILLLCVAPLRADDTPTPTDTATVTPTITRTPAPAVRTYTPVNDKPMFYDEPGGAFNFARGNTTNGLKVFTDYPWFYATHTPVLVSLAYSAIIDDGQNTFYGIPNLWQDEPGGPTWQYVRIFNTPTPTATAMHPALLTQSPTPTDTPTITPTPTLSAPQQPFAMYVTIANFGNGGFVYSNAVTFPYAVTGFTFERGTISAGLNAGSVTFKGAFVTADNIGLYPPTDVQTNPGGSVNGYGRSCVLYLTNVTPTPNVTPAAMPCTIWPNWNQ